jgi:predicted phosphodiesterase
MKLLHFSDLHITTTDADTQFDSDAKIREAIMTDIGKNGRTNFDAILVTGDIAYHGRADEFARAKAWLEEVRKKTFSPPEAIFVIPGNHDVNQSTVSKSSSLWELHQSLRKDMSDQDRLASLNKKLHDPFDFLAALSEYTVFASEYGCPTHAEKLAWVQVLDGKQVLDDGTSVRFHGLNSALISDQEDKRGNLLLGATQFHHFDSHPGYVNVVLCHHPHPWLLDGNAANDFFRNQAHVILCGHEHMIRVYTEGRSLRVFAGAVHPNPREAHWEPCYHVLNLGVDTAGKRTLVVRVETRVWRDRDKCFGPHVQEDGTPFLEVQIELPDWKLETDPQPTHLDSKLTNSAVPSTQTMTATTTLTSDSYSASRRRLIVHFFRLGTISRYQTAMDAGVWEESDDALTGQARWSRVFERAEKTQKLGALWAAVAAKDETLTGQPNPFNS